MPPRHLVSAILAATLCVAAVRAQAAEPVTEDNAPVLSLVTLNLWNDKGDWPKRERQIVASLRDLHPDVVALQEVLQHPGLPNQAQSIAEALGYRYVFSSVDAADEPQRLATPS
jgi:endonuclease/exonuclease/phosphatase family metal-dependent hydrolase